MRVVLDTNLLVRAVHRPGGPAGRLFCCLVEPPHRLVTSGPLLYELERVLRYPRLRSVHGRTDDDIDQLVGDVRRLSEVTTPAVLQTPIVVDDRDDDVVVSTAMAGRAEAIVTLDKHLHDPGVVRACEEFGIRIVTDTELLGELGGTRDAA